MLGKLSRVSLSLVSLWLATLRRADARPPTVPPGLFLAGVLSRLCTSGCDAAANLFSSSLQSTQVSEATQTAVGAVQDA